MKSITYEDLFKIQEILKKDEFKPKVFVFYPEVIKYGKKEGVIREESDGRMFLQNLHDLINGSEIFASNYVPSPKYGYEVSKVIYDEFERK